MHIQTGNTAIERFHDAPPRIKLKFRKAADMPALTPCAKTAGAGHFTERSPRNNPGYDGAGQDRVGRRGRTTKRETTSCPLSSTHQHGSDPKRPSCSRGGRRADHDWFGQISRFTDRADPGHDIGLSLGGRVHDYPKMNRPVTIDASAIGWPGLVRLLFHARVWGNAASAQYPTKALRLPRLFRSCFDQS